MFTHKKLNQMAYSHATVKLISNLEGCGYQNYQKLVRCLSQPDELKDWIPILPYKDCSWSEILELIDSEAQVILEAMQSALEFAKQGLILAAPSQPLKNVFVGLDMQQIVAAGAA